MVVVLGACGSGSTVEPVAQPATLEPTTTPAPTATPPPPSVTPVAATQAADPGPTNTPAATNTPAPAAEPSDWSNFESVTAAGFYERGNPDAPILILDYSDFL